MNRIKVINETTDLVPILRAVETPVRKDVFKELVANWRTEKEIKEKWGDEGVEALRFFDKLKLTETKWITSAGTAQPEKAYHAFYSSLHISANTPIMEISDVLHVVMMPEKEYKKVEEQIFKKVSSEGTFAGDLAEEVGVSLTMLKALVKRSGRLDYRGHRVEKFGD